jgi:hypothetical protein
MSEVGTINWEACYRCVHNKRSGCEKVDELGVAIFHVDLVEESVTCSEFSELSP